MHSHSGAAQLEDPESSDSEVEVDFNRTIRGQETLVVPEGLSLELEEEVEEPSGDPSAEAAEVAAAEAIEAAQQMELDAASKGSLFSHFLPIPHKIGFKKVFWPLSAGGVNIIIFLPIPPQNGF